MANSKKKRKRLKRQLNKRFKQTGTVLTVETIELTKESPKELFQKALDKAYNGAVKPLNSYVNEHATLCFKCENCGVRFFNSPRHMVGKEEAQRHLCHFSYGDRHGVRRVGGNNDYDRYKTPKPKKKKKKSKNTEQRGKELVKQLDELLDQGLNYPTIRRKTGVNIQLIEYYADTFHKKGG